jgi:2-polyprenyl-6-methoxyphenol hydroxylase-like FAD-dependent oxidoreductase
VLRERRAEVVGAGLSGLFVACALAQRGWKVRVHERGSDLRMFGAGIWLWENGLRSLEAIGALDDAIARGQRMSAWEIRDKHDRLIRRREALPWDRLIVPPRADLYESLKAVAAREGVEVEVNSRAVGADPAGEVEFAEGTRARADLVVAADGIRSALRESLGQTKSFRPLGNGAIRLLIPRRPDELADVASEHWNGNRVLLYNPCTPDHVYLCMVAPADDERGKRVPVDRETWCESFPLLEHAIERIDDDSGRWDDFETVVSKRWSVGKVAIIGDASHGQPPWLGQAANLAFANALALAEFVSYGNDVEKALERWEHWCRPSTDHTERWTNAYGRVVSVWPESFDGVRAGSMRLFTRLPRVEKMLNVAQRTPVVGADTSPLRPRGQAALV